MISLQVHGIEQTAKKLNQVSNDLHGRPMAAGMQQATMLVTADAKRLAPVDTGRLRASITPDVEVGAKEVVGVVGSNVVYAPYMELGTRPHWPPPGALAAWARRHGVSEYVVARAIAARGTKERRFLRGSFEQNRGKVEQIIGQAVSGIVQR
ncbi:MAG: HK97 gp10 family phage protein [Proteobacteria bacterium]|nr:HK97 gp10 family phage protein [Pseudomonadota bacterium]